MRRVFCLALAALVFSSCGVGAEQSPQKLDPRSVPFGLLAPATSTTTTTQVAESTVFVYLQGSQRLVRVARTVPSPTDIPAVLKELDAGPTAAESGQGMTSPISSAAPLKLLSFRAGVASIDAPPSFEALGGQDQIVAAAQLVFTLTGLPGVSGVDFLVGGQPTQVPTAGGSLSQGPLTRADYGSLGPS